MKKLHLAITMVITQSIISHLRLLKVRMHFLSEAAIYYGSDTFAHCFKGT